MNDGGTPSAPHPPPADAPSGFLRVLVELPYLVLVTGEPHNMSCVLRSRLLRT